MLQLLNFGDERQTAFCAYCGDWTETTDHVPPRVFLDRPYPNNLQTVFACRACNQGAALDEEYVACLIECAAAGSASPDLVQRDKIRRILARKPALARRLARARREEAGVVYFTVEAERVRRVIVKLARGHALHQLNEPQLAEPVHIAWWPLISLSGPARAAFEEAPVLSILPEVGSRAMQRLMQTDDGVRLDWMVVQPGRYRYLVYPDRTFVQVRIVLGECLACEVIWDDRVT